MKPSLFPGITTLIGILACGSISVAAAQSSQAKSHSEDTATESAVTSAPADDTLATVTDTTPEKKKGGGLFGKVKSVAKNKVVQQVAKTAACTMLPGGQVVAGAIDAAANKDAVGAAAGAATGSTCMPGMGGAAGAMAGGAIPGAAGLSAAAAAGAGGPPSGMDPAMMAAYSAQMAAAMQAMMAQGGKNGGAGMPPGMPPGMAPGAMAMPPGMGMPPGATGTPGEGGGKALEVSPDLAGELKEGKTVIRNIDWIPGGGTVSPAGTDVFALAMAQVAAAMKRVGGSYRLDLYMDKQSGDVVVKTLGPQRLATVRAALVEGGAAPPPDGPQIGKSKKDGDPRLEVVRLK